MAEEMVQRSPTQEKYGMVQCAIRLLVLLVFLGWIFIWIMAPTNTYKQIWLPKVRAKTSSTYIGAQSASILLFTSPVLLIAALGCVYLHIAKKTNDTKVGYGWEYMLVIPVFPVARGSSVLPLLGLTSESCIKYHIWLGHILMTLFTSHGLCYIIVWAATDQLSEMLTWDKHDISIIAGELSLLSGLFLRQVRLVSARVLPCQVVELNFSKGHGLTYNPTSVMFINVPSISKLQWHPFTITSNSNLEPERLSVVIKSEGIWSQKLYQMLSTPSSIDRLGVSVEGPYGPASTNYLRHDTLVMVGGGSGITPFVSIIRELIYLSTTFKIKTPKSCPDLCFQELFISVNVYITRDNELKQDSLTHPQTIWFKPNPTDAPVHAILAIVASAAVLWNKRHTAKEAKQIQNLEGSTPTASPNSMIYNADRELESLPYQSLAQATNVYYGVRPDIRRMLFDFKGSSVGVLVSGPQKK
ncbi:Riboflavin synthase-like beta-barrel [Sesbania bispinosa]|nr:Riboflavin synthase-like beta-barrel [Sesbania bispinosa]